MYVGGREGDLIRRSAILKPPTSPLILDDAGTVAHVWFRGASLIDTRGNAWTTNGSVAITPRSGKTPAGAGPFSDANYYSLGTGNDVLDFAGDFRVAFVFSSLAGVRVFFANANQTGFAAGYAVYTNGTPAAGVLNTYNAGTQGAATTVNTVAAGVLSVICAWRSGATIGVKMNLGAAATSTPAGVITAATANSAKLGRNETVGNAYAGTLYEAAWSSLAGSDAWAIDVMNRVKAKAGVTAW